MSAYSSYSSYVSSALTTASNKYTALRRALLNDEADGDTEDDSHVCRVLRAYYTEKGRQFPEWLPPDPKAPPPPPPATMISSARQGGYGGQQQQQRSSGGLSDLWGDGGRGVGQQAPTSLRGGRGSNMSDAQPVASSRTAMPSRPGIVDSYQRGGAAAGQAQQEARPLPSQRAGSYQSSLRSPPADQTPPGSSAGAASAQDRLKARLWGGGRSASPVQSQSTNSTPGLSSVGSRNPYESAPSSGYGGGRDAGPQMSANSPWSGGGDNYGGYTGGGGYGNSGNPYGGSSAGTAGSRSRTGLPSGPRGGLPSGPRPKK